MEKKSKGRPVVRNTALIDEMVRNQVFRKYVQKRYPQHKLFGHPRIILALSEEKDEK